MTIESGDHILYGIYRVTIQRITTNLVTINLVTNNLVTNNLVTKNLMTKNLVTMNLVTMALTIPGVWRQWCSLQLILPPTPNYIVHGTSAMNISHSV